MADYDCDYCKYEKKCVLYGYICPYNHLFGKTPEDIEKEKVALTSAINDLESAVSKLKNINPVDLEDNINSIKNNIFNLGHMYSDETISEYMKLL